MTCRHDLSPATRKKVNAINLVILVLKLTEITIVVNERRRRAALRNKLATSIVAAERRMTSV